VTRLAIPTDGQPNVRVSGELPLTLIERMLLFVGLDIASVLIAFVERSPRPAMRQDRTL
jgi:hypothetical protein